MLLYIYIYSFIHSFIEIIHIYIYWVNYTMVIERRNMGMSWTDFIGTWVCLKMRTTRKMAVFERTCNLADLVASLASLSHSLRENDGKPVDFGIQWDTPDTLFSDKPIWLYGSFLSHGGTPKSSKSWCLGAPSQWCLGAHFKKPPCMRLWFQNSIVPAFSNFWEIWMPIAHSSVVASKSTDY